MLNPGSEAEEDWFGGAKLIYEVFFSGTTIDEMINLLSLNLPYIYLRLGHAPMSLVHKLQLPYVDYEKVGVCDICHFAKLRKASFFPSFNHATRPFALLHVDNICGSYSVTSVYGHKYILSLVDDFSRFIWIILLK